MMGRVQSALNTNNRSELGTAMPALSGQTQSAIDQLTRASGRISDIAGGWSPARGALDNASHMISGLIGDPTHSGSAYGNIWGWTTGDFSSSPGYSGLLKTARGDFLPGAMPTFTVAPSAGSVSSTGGTLATSPSAGPGGLTMASGSGNPYADSIVRQAANAAQSATNSSFGVNGRYSGGANQNALVSNVSDAAARILSPILENERNRQLQAQGLLGQAQGQAAGLIGGAQMQAAGMAPALRQSDYLDPSMALNAGSSLLNVGQILDQRASDEANSPYRGLRNAFGLLGGMGGQTTTTPYYTNPFGDALGGALGGAALYRGLLGSKQPSSPSSQFTASPYQGGNTVDWYNAKIEPGGWY